MTTNRREFLAASASGIALLIAFGPAACRGSSGRLATGNLTPNQWLRIDATGRVTVINDKSEMGQGSASVVPMIVAEELGAPLSAITVEHAQPGKAFDDMGTSGSDTVAGRWEPLRNAAASAREMLVAAAAAMWGVPATDCTAQDGTVRHAASARSAPFGDLVAAASRLPIPTQPILKPDSSYTLVGTRVPRLDTRGVVTGTKVYGMDFKIPGMLKAVIARCPSPSGRITTWSGSAAKRVAGVRTVAQVSNGIAVVADNTWAAFKGRDALEISWDESAGRAINSDSLWNQLAGGFEKFGKVARREGNPQAAIAHAARTFSAEYRYPFQAHAALEPLNAIAHVRAGGCEIWAGTQNPNRVQGDVATLLRCPKEDVVVHVLPLGGAFGRRISPDFVLEAVEVSRAAGAPVQLVWSREDDFTHDMYQSAAIVRMGAGIDSSGSIVGWSHQVADFDLTMFGDFDPATYDPKADLEPWGGIDTPYAFPAIDVRLARQRSPVRTGAWRSVFYPSSVFARESFLDEIAHATGKDPLALRLALLAPPNVVTRNGVSFDNRARLRRVLALAAEEGGWGTPLPDVGPGRRVGRGIACNEYHRRTVVANVAEVSVGPAGDVKVHRVVCAMDCGRPVNLSGIEAQIEGGVMWGLSTLMGREITFEGGRAMQTSFDAFPVIRMSGAPKVEAHIVPSSLPPWGVGEQPVPAVSPAVLNAVFAATGQRIRRLPLAGQMTGG
jgi:isoquinoline 1-oxidoreductase beta subunit